MLTISQKKLWAVLSGVDDDDDDVGVDQATMDAVNALDIKAIVFGFMTQNHIGGDDVVGIVDQVLAAQKEGYSIVTWYGPAAEVLVLGVREGDLNLVA